MAYGIKYNIDKVNESLYMLTPFSLVKGNLVIKDEDERYFDSDEKYDLFSVGNEEALNGDFIVNNVWTSQELQEEYEDNDVEFCAEFLFEEEKDYLTFVSLADGYIERISRLKISEIMCSDQREVYELINKVPSVVLNSNSIFELLKIENIEQLKEKLEQYKKRCEYLKARNVSEGITKVSIKNGLIEEVSFEENIKIFPEKKVNVNTNKVKEETNSFISVQGLEQYMKERILGHNSELRYIATVLVMNQTAAKVDGTESILIPGPTGTGKTATFEVASEYLGLPFLNINSANLVPAGIKGVSIEDELARLVHQCDNNLELAKKAIVVCDEFDKLEESDLDIKTVIKEIFLKYIEGGEFIIPAKQWEDDVIFDTSMISKVFLGTFSKLYESKKTLGFLNESTSISDIDLATLYNGKYFDKELLSRISHVIPYKDIDYETKLKIILESKLSTYLLKKNRLVREYGIETFGDYDFARGILDRLKAEDRSIRDLNNIIRKQLLDIEYEILAAPGKYKKLVL